MFLLAYRDGRLLGVLGLAVLVILAQYYLIQLTRAVERQVTLAQMGTRAVETERRNLTSDLHDVVLQELYGTYLMLAQMVKRMTGDQEDHPSHAELREVMGLAAAATRKANHELRTLSIEVYPNDLHDTGLPHALRRLLARLENQGVTTHLDAPDRLELPEAVNGKAVETIGYRVAQEALRNVEKYAKASSVTIRVSVSPDRMALVVEDDGLGFSAEQRRQRREEGHGGLYLLAQQAAAVRAHVRVESEPGRGTRVHLEVPLA